MPMSSETSKLFVGGLPAQTTHADLVKLFGTAGAVFGVKIVMDRQTNRSKGFAFVEMATAADAQAALKKLDGYKVVDRRIFITAARPQEKRAELPGAKPAAKPGPVAKAGRPGPGEPGFVERRSGKDRRKPDAPIPAKKSAANPGGFGPGFSSKKWKKPGRTGR
jgi:RNA recognition motif-containing protein